MSVSIPPKNKVGPVVRMKMRSDLTYDDMTYQGVEYVVIKEPLGQKYYQFPPHVFHMLQQLDGTRTIDELMDNFHQNFAPKRITRNELQQLLTRFHKDGLVISDVAGQGNELLKRGRQNKFMERISACSNILAVRYRGFDPEMILNWLNRWIWWLFTPAAVMIWTVLGAIAMFSVIVNFAEFQSRMPGFEQFFNPRNWWMFVGVMAGTKVLHEFGHGLSCKRLGGECHEIGFMLLVLTPCLYCNVSDSWRLPNKWHRAAIGAAGMYVELILATIATFVWWFVPAGFIQDVCLQVMLISSISTVLFNGNPLLRFDGYYILSDLLEIPNMYQKSTKALTTLLGRNWLGLEIPDDQLMPSNRPWAFATYTVAAFCYRWMILFSIVWFLTVWLEPYGLESVGKGIAIFSMVGMLVWPSYKLYKYMSVPGRMHQVEKPRFFIILACFLAVLAGILFTPFPHYLRCSVILMPQEMETLYVEQPGILKECFVKQGDVVEAGTTIAKFENIDLELAFQQKYSELVEKRGARQNMKRASSANRDPTYVEDLLRLNSEIVALTQTVKDIKTRMQKLEIKTRIAGTVMATPFQEASPSVDLPLVDQQAYLTQINEGVSVVTGQRFGEIADLDHWEAIVLLDEQQVKFVEHDMYVKIKLYSQAGTIMESTVKSYGAADQSIQREKRNSYDPTAMPQSRLPDLVTEMVAANQKSTIQYFARVPVSSTEGAFKVGLGGQARLYTGYRSLGARVWWWINQNFRT